MKRLKKLTAIVVAICMLLSIIPFNLNSVYAAEGTPIKTQEDLERMSASGTYYLANDIELTGEWTPKRFEGIFDGCGHKITGLEVTEGLNDGYNAYRYGLFAEISGTAEVRNLGVEGSIIIADKDEEFVYYNAGLLAGIISNDYYNPEKYARVNNCWAIGTITVDTAVEGNIGGLVGTYNSGIASNCYSAVPGVDIVGKAPLGDLNNFYYDSTLYTGTSIAGTGKTTQEMKSQAFADLLNTNAGEYKWGYTAGKYVELQATGDSTSGGDNSAVVISTEEDLKNIANNLSGNYVLANDIALAEAWTVIGSSKEPFSGTLDGQGHTITGFSYSGNIADCGLFGANSGIIKNLGLEGACVATGYTVTNIGLIAGTNTGKIINCYAKGTITPKYATRSGLIAGNNLDGVIENCYVVGSGSKNPVATGGKSATGPHYISCYYDSEVFAKSPTAMDGVEAKTTSEMQAEEFVKLLNSNTNKDMDWSYVASAYPVLGKAPAQAEMVTIAFVDGDSVVEKQIAKGSSLDYTPEAPTKAGYTFVGWFKDVDNINTKYQAGQEFSADATYTAKYAHMEMLGASAKKIVDNKSGIRFGTKVFDDGDEIVEKGTIILPANMLEEGQKLTLDTPKAIVSVGKVAFETNTEENSVVYLGTLINIPEAQFDRQITASSYVKYMDKSGNEYIVYSSYQNNSTSINDLLK